MAKVKEKEIEKNNKKSKNSTIQQKTKQTESTDNIKEVVQQLINQVN